MKAPVPAKSPGSKTGATAPCRTGKPTKKQSGAFAYAAARTGTKNIRGLPNFMHGKNAGRSMILRGT